MQGNIVIYIHPNAITLHTQLFNDNGNIPISDLNIFDIRVSDHKAISLSLENPSSNPPPPTERVMKYRNLHNLETPLFLDSIIPNLSMDLSSSSPNDIINLYNTTLTTVLNTLATEQTRKATFQRSSPWFTGDLRRMKTCGRKLERLWRNPSTGLQRAPNCLCYCSKSCPLSLLSCFL